jgi:hypothetical protein
MPSLADLELQPSHGGRRLVDVLRKPAMPPPALGDEAAQRSGLLISLVTIRALVASYIAHQKDCTLVDFVRGVILVKHNARNLLLSPRFLLMFLGRSRLRFFSYGFEYLSHRVFIWAYWLYSVWLVPFCFCC